MTKSIAFGGIVSNLGNKCWELILIVGPNEMDDRD